MKRLMLLASSLMVMNITGTVITINNEAQFNKEILQSNKPAIVKVGATWCPACVRSESPFEKMSHDYPDIVFATMDTDKNDTLSNKYGVMSLPTFLYFNNGQLVTKKTGFAEREVKQTIANELQSTSSATTTEKKNVEAAAAAPAQESTATAQESTATAQETKQANAGCPMQGVGASFIERAYYSVRDFFVSLGQTVQSWFK